jgi:hypothetical protein
MGWYTVYVSQLGYGISPRVLSWLRLPAGQKTSSMVSVSLVGEPVDVLDDEVLEDEEELAGPVELVDVEEPGEEDEEDDEVLDELVPFPEVR